jgi:hypothetical protein
VLPAGISTDISWVKRLHSELTSEDSDEPSDGGHRKSFGRCALCGWPAQEELVPGSLSIEPAFRLTTARTWWAPATGTVGEETYPTLDSQSRSRA